MEQFLIKVDGRKECTVNVLSDKIQIVYFDASKGTLQLDTLGEVAEIIDNWRDSGHSVVVHNAL